MIGRDALATEPWPFDLADLPAMLGSGAFASGLDALNEPTGRIR